MRVVLGSPFTPVSAEGALSRCLDIIQEKKSRHAITANVDFLARASNSPSIQRIILDADEVFCDGMPLVWASRLSGSPLPGRVTGSDLVPALLSACAREGHSVFFLGSDPDTLTDLRKNLGRELPNLRIAGAVSPPFGSIDSWSNEEIVEEINASQPDVLFVAVGFPKQDEWIQRFGQRLQVPLKIGVGASLDFMVGKQIRAPHWMRRSGLEWTWRLATAPRRLMRRYTMDALMLSKLLVRQLFLNISNALPPLRSRPDHLQPLLNGLKLPESAKMIRWENGRAPCLPRLEAKHKKLIFDLSGLDSFSHEALDALVSSIRECRRRGLDTAHFSANARFRGALRRYGIEEYPGPVFECPVALSEWIASEASKDASLQKRTEKQSRRPSPLSSLPLFRLSLILGLGIFMAAPSLFGQSMIVTVAEDPLNMSSSLQNIDVFDFNSVSTGYNYHVNWEGVGTFDQLYVKNADRWGGAGDASFPGGSPYSVQGVGKIDQTVLSLDTSSSYFGMWWSAGDSANRLSFYNGEDLVSQFTTSTLMNALPGEYYGHPLDKTQVTWEPYGFINFYAGENASWDSIVFDNGGQRSGFEADNFTSRVFSYDAETDGEDSFGTVVAEVVEYQTFAIDEVPSDWSPDLVNKVPGAPTPGFYALVTFAAIFGLKGLTRRSSNKEASQ